jgi:hypothetical protein
MDDAVARAVVYAIGRPKIPRNPREQDRGIAVGFLRVCLRGWQAVPLGFIARP